MKISIIKVDGVLYPVGEQSIEESKRLKNGVEYVCNVAMNRNSGFHRKAFALFKMLFDSQEKYDNFDVFWKMLIMKGGRFVAVVYPNGMTAFWPESISFEEMTQDEFEKLFQKIITHAVKECGQDEKMLWRILGFT